MPSNIYSQTPAERTRSGGTSHIVVADASGMAFSFTSTINLFFGSRVMVPSTGIILNNQMNGDSSSPFLSPPSPSLTLHLRLLHPQCHKHIRLLPLPSQLRPSSRSSPLLHLPTNNLSPQRNPLCRPWRFGGFSHHHRNLAKRLTYPRSWTQRQRSFSQAEAA